MTGFWRSARGENHGLDSQPGDVWVDLVRNKKETTMGSDICWLITVLYGTELVQCALKVERDTIPGDCAEYPMEPENRKAIHALLPLHVQSCGPIVAVDPLFEVHIANNMDMREKREG